MDPAPPSYPSAWPDREFALLLFQAAGCLMALPASEVARLAGSSAGPPSADRGDPRPAGAIDLDVHFGRPGGAGPWIAWRRGARQRDLRVSRVIGVSAYEWRDLRPMPRWLRATQAAGPFWAMGTSDNEEVFLVLDPERLVASER